MFTADNSTTFLNLRNKFKRFIYEGYTIEQSSEMLKIRYSFNLSDSFFFHPVIEIPLSTKNYTDKLSTELLDNLVFHIGMIEMLSYWKAACSPQIIIKGRYLDMAQIKWWKTLYYHGLGEFFHINNINTNIEDFVNFEIEGTDKLNKSKIQVFDRPIIPMGGGKDSAVTYDLLRKAGEDVMVFFLNPQHLPVDVIHVNNYKVKQVVAYRTICPELIQLNKKGFLNGHTPFSAVLGFISLLMSVIYLRKNIVLSNESSANESTIPGTKINHQYSKTFEFETNFRTYISEYISEDLNYFSFLRPITELQIARLFSDAPYFFEKFRSCNVGSKTGVWCNKCPKCLFTFIILSPFINPTQLKHIFGQNLFNDIELLKSFNELTGLSEIKPFECIGTVEEVNVALVMAIKRYYKHTESLPALIQYYKGTKIYDTYKAHNSEHIISQFDNNNHLPEKYLHILKSAISWHEK